MSLTIRERLQALLDGKKIRDISWRNTEYIYLDKDNIKDEKDVDHACGMIGDDLDEYEIFEEPKEKTVETIFFFDEIAELKMRIKKVEDTLIGISKL